MSTFQTSRDHLAWGRAHRYTHAVARPRFADELPALVTGAERGSLLAFGMGRSYGDSCLNRDRRLIDMRGLDRFIAFDPDAGVIECEAGVTLSDILRLLARPGDGRRWFLPVTPGTRFVTVGGAVANDVHGKNHHSAGCFGNHVEGLRLLRSDGSAVDCTPSREPALFRATVGGLGLTGLIASVRLRLKPVPGPWMEVEDIRYDDLDAFHALSEESVADWEYTVAWIDCLAKGAALGRGVFTRARHAESPRPAPELAPAAGPGLPVDLPGFALNRWSIAAFNAAYWRRAPRHPQRRIAHYAPVFYPLDAIGGWNRMYGARGFFQYQCALPTDTARDAVRELLSAIAASGAGSFLAVLKTLGDRPSPGMLSFPMPGTTLALDFPNDGWRTRALLDRLDAIVAAAGGRLYPAKDGRMPASLFQQGYPAWRSFSRHVDPAFSSSFWRRVSAPLPGDTEP